VLSPNAPTFPVKVVGTRANPRPVTVTNTSPNSVTIFDIAITGTNPTDFSQTHNCGASLAGHSSCTIEVTFQPTNINNRVADLVVTDSAVGGSQLAQLVGTGTAVSLSPINLTFGPQTVGTVSPAQTITLSNTTSTALTITGIAISGTNTTDFAQTNTCGTGIAAKARCTISVTFTPTATGTRRADVSITDNGGASPQSVPLTGTGQ